MNHFQQIQAALKESELDGVLLTGEFNRFYGSGFHSTGSDGVALVTRTENYYFTDSRYIEAAEHQVSDAAIAMTETGRGYVTLLNEVIDRCGLKCLGFEDKAMTVSRDKLGPSIGRIDPDKLVEVERCLAVFLGIAK